jgi:hypothetical protein
VAITLISGTLATDPSCRRSLSSPDGKEIVFDRVHENSNTVLIDLPK